MIAVSWGDGRVAVVDRGQVIDSSSPAARREVEQRLSIPATIQFPGDYHVTYQPGEPEHTRAALSLLDMATLTEA